MSSDRERPPVADRRRKRLVVKPFRRSRPVLEVMESKALLSVGSTVLPVGHAVTASISEARHRSGVVLTGHVKGTYQDQTTIPDNPSEVSISGSGRVGPLGNVKASGVFHQLGFIARGNATGTVNLSNARGGVTLQLTGPTQPGFSPLPSTFQFRIVSATGHDKGLNGSGVADLGLGASQGTFTLTFHR